MLRFMIGDFSVDLFSVYIPVLLVVVPPVVVRFVFVTTYARQQPYWTGWKYLVAAAIAWAVSIQIPNIPIGNSESVSTHVMGGAFVAPLLYAYCKCRYLKGSLVRYFLDSLELRFNQRWLRFCVLFAFTSSFAVLNELAEAVLTIVGTTDIESADTWSDLIANAFGTLLGFAGMEAARAWHRRNV